MSMTIFISKSNVKAILYTHVFVTFQLLLLDFKINAGLTPHIHVQVKH